MAAPTFVQAIAGATDSAGPWSYSFSGVTSGNVCILQILSDGLGVAGISSVSGIANLAGTGSSLTTIVENAPVGSGPDAYQHLYIGRFTATSGSISGDTGTSIDVYIRLYTFANVSSGTTLAAVIEQNGTTTPSTSSGTSGTIADAGVTTTGTNRLALNFVSINDDNALAAMTGMTGGTWTEAVAEYADSAGTDGCIQLQLGFKEAISVPGPAYLSISSGTTKVGQSFTPATGGTLSQFSTSIYRSASASGNGRVSIQTDSSDYPSGSILWTTDWFDWPTAATEYQFNPDISLSASTRYWIVWERNNDNVYPYYIGSNTSDILSGEGKRTYSTSWSSETNEDMGFLVGFVGSAGTIDGGTATNSDATDGWGVVGFALIGTTVAATSLLPRPHRPTRYLIRR